MAELHELKIDPMWHHLICNRIKRCELRKNDRGFLQGDILALRETRYSSREMRNLQEGREISIAAAMREDLSPGDILILIETASGNEFTGAMVIGSVDRLAADIWLHKFVYTEWTPGIEWPQYVEMLNHRLISMCGIHERRASMMTQQLYREAREKARKRILP
uniref:DUF3850 domain-containing protein n=1 Tax=Candidatus Kentrum sp. FM TaxID=2126340 RepID=A0A450VSU6_9GAMM|nr:MAG: protein of unknown function (DUF3850) [Candidatus Kentron sp. FM]VFJ47841.1 MAG: protein of unknown function (DUF3850) [Candidatus Kentron sp. FM]VFK07862.1 MAG: protein of unknown function (DUF3850) [Candidatus Kentron sp. FM]